MLHVMIRIDALIAALVSRLPILESRFNFALTYDLRDVIVSNITFIFTCRPISAGLHFVINFALTYT